MKLLSEQAKYPNDVIPKSLGLTFDGIFDNHEQLWITSHRRYDNHK